MKKPEPYIDAIGDRYLNMDQAAKIVCGVSDNTLRRWAEQRKTSFGFPLRIKDIPVLIHRNGRLRGEAPPRKPLVKRPVMLEEDAVALKQILEAAGRFQPGPWSPNEMATLEAKSIDLLRRRKREEKSHVTRLEL